MQLNNILINEVLRNIPEHIKPANYLVELLEISLDSAYRRLRGDIAFTYSEAVRLAIDLNFSLDKLFGQSEDQHATFDISTNNIQNAEESVYTMFHKFFLLLQGKNKAKKSFTMLAVNHLLPIYTISFDHILRFFYYKWVHQQSDAGLNLSYSEVPISGRIKSICDEIHYYNIDTTNSIYRVIFDSNVYINFINEVLYYHKRKLLTDGEFFAIKDDLFKLIDYTEKISQKDVEKKTSLFLYLSSLEIGSNTGYTQYDDKVEAFFWVHPFYLFKTSHPTSCQIHKNWLDSLKKYSALISQSNEILLAEFFHKQRQYLEETSIEDSSYYL